VIHASRFASGHLNDLRLRLYGTQGGLDVRFEKQESHLSICQGENLETGTWVDVAPLDVVPNYARFIAAIRNATQVSPDFARGATLQRVLDLAVVSDAENARDQRV
jgi:predicted dehydrogenase